MNGDAHVILVTLLSVHTYALDNAPSQAVTLDGTSLPLKRDIISERPSYPVLNHSPDYLQFQLQLFVCCDRCSLLIGGGLIV